MRHTYADTVHRGFVELNAAVTLSALAIVTVLSRSTAQPLPGVSKATAVALIVESQILAISALHRVQLYEAAYGYTEQRLLVQVYAGVTIAALALLGWETMGKADFRQLTRRTWALGMVTLCGLVYWNHEAWIVRANVARYQSMSRATTLPIQKRPLHGTDLNPVVGSPCALRSVPCQAI